MQDNPVKERLQSSGIRRQESGNPKSRDFTLVDYSLPICGKRRYLVRQKGIFAENVALP
jgi:hypothetical protein